MEDDLDKIFRELETLDREWVINSVPVEYAMIWTPDNNIRLWSVPRSTGKFLKQLVLMRRPKNILEIGTSAGYSTLWMASALSVYGGTVHTIEAAQPKIEMAANYFRQAKLEKYIHQIHGLAADVLADFNEPIDFLFMDADKKNYMQYFSIIEPKLTVKAVVVADNAIDYGDLMEDFLGHLENSPSFESQVLDLDNGLLLAVKK